MTINILFYLMQQRLFNKQVELCKNQLTEWEESSLNIRNIKHDIKNHLICIREYIETICSLRKNILKTY